jgi:hypothetical protein
MQKKSLEEFRSSLSRNEPPEDFTPQAEALWYAGKGHWEKAHMIVQDQEDPLSYRIHAFLHRREGDHSNARYWYDKAGSNMPEKLTDLEWEDIVSSI